MTHGNMRRPLAGAALAALALALAGCSDDPSAEGGEQTAEVSDETLAAVIADADGMSVASETLGDAGLSQVFDGGAAYTLLVPGDMVFDELGEAGEALRAPEQRPAMVAILRDHIVPGYLTPEDIGNAIELADDGSVEMTTMGDKTVTFTQEGDTISVAGEDGSTATFAGNAMRASNGVAIPIDGLLQRVEAEAPQG